MSRTITQVELDKAVRHAELCHPYKGNQKLVVDAVLASLGITVAATQNQEAWEETIDPLEVQREKIEAQECDLAATVETMRLDGLERLANNDAEHSRIWGAINDLKARTAAMRAAAAKVADGDVPPGNRNALPFPSLQDEIKSVISAKRNSQPWVRSEDIANSVIALIKQRKGIDLTDDNAIQKPSLTKTQAKDAMDFYVKRIDLGQFNGFVSALASVGITVTDG